MPIITQGSDITTIVPAVENTPAMQYVTLLVLRWQLAHPDRNKEQCQAWLGTEAAGEVQDLVDKFKKPKPKKKQNAA